jgi:hypothetical protein
MTTAISIILAVSVARERTSWIESVRSHAAARASRFGSTLGPAPRSRGNVVPIVAFTVDRSIERERDAQEATCGMFATAFDAGYSMQPGRALDILSVSVTFPKGTGVAAMTFLQAEEVEVGIDTAYSMLVFGDHDLKLTR